MIPKKFTIVVVLFNFVSHIRNMLKNYISIGFLLYLMYLKMLKKEELDNRAVSALSVWTRTLSNDRRGQSLDGWPKLLSGAPPCFGRHIKLLVPVAFAIVSTHSSFKEGWRQAAGRKNNCRIFITRWWKHVPTSLSGIRVGRRMYLKMCCTNGKYVANVLGLRCLQCQHHKDFRPIINHFTTP
jgi:hypothetical protein